MNIIEHLLTCLSEECGESTQVAAKANRFGLDHRWPEKGESNRRILEREIADIIGVAEELGLVIRPEDIKAKREKLRKMMALSMELGTLAGKSIFVHDDDGSCPKCSTEVENYRRSFQDGGGDEEYSFICSSCGEKFTILRRVILAEYSVKEKS